MFRMIGFRERGNFQTFRDINNFREHFKMSEMLKTHHITFCIAALQPSDDIFVHSSQLEIAARPTRSKAPGFSSSNVDVEENYKLLDND